MQKLAKQYVSYLPGVAMALLIAAVAKFIEGLLPIHVIGAAVIAMFIGMGINPCGSPMPPSSPASPSPARSC